MVHIIKAGKELAHLVVIVFYSVFKGVKNEDDQLIE